MNLGRHIYRETPPVLPELGELIDEIIGDDPGELWPLERMQEDARRRARYLEQAVNFTAPAYSTAASATGNGTTPSVALPAGIADGTLAICCIVTAGYSSTLTAASGWSPLPRMNSTTGRGGDIPATGHGTWAFYYYKFVGSSDSSTTPSWTISATRDWVITYALFTNVHQSVPFAGGEQSAGNAASASYTLPGAYAGFDGGLAVSLISANFRTDPTSTSLSGTTTNWTKSYAGINGNSNLSVIVATNSASVATASSAAQATGCIFKAGGSDTYVVGTTLVLNSADTDFTVPQISAGAIMANNTGGAGGTTNAAGTSQFVMPGTLLVGASYLDASGVTQTAKLNNTGTDYATSNTSFATIGRSGVVFSAQVTAADCAPTGGVGMTAAWTGTRNGTIIQRVYACIASTAIRQTATQEQTPSTTAPDAAALASDPYTDSRMMIFLCSNSTTTTWGTITGYTDRGGRAQTVSGNMFTEMYDKPAPQTSSDKNPPAGSGFSSRTYCIFTVELGPPATLPSNLVAPSISGTIIEFSTLTCVDGTWDGNPTPTITRKWQRSATGVGGWSDIVGETGTTYALQTADVGNYVRALVTGTNLAGATDAGSNVLGPILPFCNAPVNTVAPAISGTAKWLETLTCSTGTWTGDPTITYTYQWQRDNSGGGVFSDIIGETTNSYTVAVADWGCQLRCVVTANNPCLVPVTANSNTVGPIVTPPINTVAPVATGIASVGHVASSTTGTWTG